MKTTWIAAMVKKAIRTVDLPRDGSDPCGTSGLGVFIFYLTRSVCFFEVICVFCAGVFPQKTPEQIY